MAILAVMALLSPRALDAQTATVTGSIAGVVRDATGAAVPDAPVTARNLNTGFTRSVSTNSSGEYEVPLLPVGTYQIEVSHPGFTTYTQKGIDVKLAQASRVEVTLSLSATQQTVEVEANASVLTTDNTSVENTLNTLTMENIAVPSRNVLNAALFAPGLTGMRDDEFGTTQFAFGGIPRRSFMVDGVDNTQRGGQIRLGIFNEESIQEVKVISNAFSAEYGRTVGGIVNMVTRGGSNDFHGEFLYLARRPGSIARPSLAARKPFQQWTTYSANISGPIIKNRLFFFGSGEYEPLDAPIPITITPANAAALHLPASELGAAPFGQRFRTILGRTDFVVNDRNSGFVRFDYFYTPSTANSNAGGLNTRSFANDYRDKQYSGVFEFTSTLSARTVNEFRFGDEYRSFLRPPRSKTFGPSILISGVANLGTGTSANQEYVEHQSQFMDNLSHNIGAHNFKFGTDISTIRVFQGDRLTQTFQFANLAQYLGTLAGTSTYTLLTQSFGNNTSNKRTNSYNFFALDDWRVWQNFTLNLGARYELLAYPSLVKDAPLPGSRDIPNDYNNWAPRVGFSYQPTSKWVVRGGYGLFYDTTNLRLLGAAVRGTGVAVQTFNIPGTAAGAPIYPNLLAAPPGPQFGVKPSATVFAQDFRTLYMHQANFQIEREVTRNIAVTMGYIFYGGHRLPLIRDINLGAPVRFLADGRPVFSSANPRPNPNYAQIYEIESVGNSNYNGGFVAITKRFSHGLQFTASYTYSKAIDNTDSASDTGAPVEDPTNINRDRGLSSANQTHRFVLEGVYQSSWQGAGLAHTILAGWMLAPSVTLTSGMPINVTTGLDDNGDGLTIDRPLFRGRNDVIGPGFKEVNLRISRRFNIWERLRLELIGEAENLLNSTNAACGINGGCTGAVVSTFGAPDFGRVTAALHSRQVQVGGKLQF
jgi:hypothetical protein